MSFIQVFTESPRRRTEDRGIGYSRKWIDDNDDAQYDCSGDGHAANDYDDDDDDNDDNDDNDDDNDDGDNYDDEYLHVPKVESR